MSDDPKTRPSTKRISDVIIGVAVMFWIITIYIIASHYKEIQKLVFGTTETASMMTHMSINSSIKAEISKLLDVTNADRILVYQYYNPNNNDPDQTVFTFARATHEIARSGVSYEASKRQTLIISMFSSWYNVLKTGNCLTTVTEVDENPYYSKYLRETGVKATIKCPLFNTSRIMIGSISVEYTGGVPDNNNLIAYQRIVAASASRIGAILSLKTTP